MKKVPKSTYPTKKALRSVTTRDYNVDMKTAAMLDSTHDGATESAVVREMAPVAGIGTTISVRAAKAHLSGLLDQVAAGREVIITSDGVPKARIVPIDRAAKRPVFTGTREHLKAMPKWQGGKTAEEVIREDRDSRG